MAKWFRANDLFRNQMEASRTKVRNLLKSVKPTSTRSFKLLLGLGLWFCSTLGCGPRELPFTDNSKDSVAFALSMKTLVLNTTENLKTSKEPADTLGGVVLSLSELGVCPTGEYLKTYQEIHSLASALKAECEKGKPAGFDAKVKAIAELAKTLPGNVEPVKRGND